MCRIFQSVCCTAYGNARAGRFGHQWPRLAAGFCNSLRIVADKKGVLFIHRWPGAARDLQCRTYRFSAEHDIYPQIYPEPVFNIVEVLTIPACYLTNYLHIYMICDSARICVREVSKPYGSWDTLTE